MPATNPLAAVVDELGGISSPGLALITSGAAFGPGCVKLMITRPSASVSTCDGTFKLTSR